MLRTGLMSQTILRDTAVSRLFRRASTSESRVINKSTEDNGRTNSINMDHLTKISAIRNNSLKSTSVLLNHDNIDRDLTFQRQLMFKGLRRFSTSKLDPRDILAGGYLAVLNNKKNIEIYSLAKPRQEKSLLTLEGPKSTIKKIVFNSLGDIVTAITEDENVIYQWTDIFNVPQLKTYTFFNNHARGLTVACNSDASVIAVGYNILGTRFYGVQVIKTIDPMPFDLYHSMVRNIGTETLSLKFHPNDNELALGVRANIIFWDTHNLQRNTPNSHKSSAGIYDTSPLGIVYNSNGTKLAGGNDLNSRIPNKEFRNGFILNFISATESQFVSLNKQANTDEQADTNVNPCVAFSENGRIVTGGKHMLNSDPRPPDKKNSEYAATHLWDREGNLLIELNKNCPFLGRKDYKTNFVSFDDGRIISISSTETIKGLIADKHSVVRECYQDESGEWIGQEIASYDGVVKGFYFPSAQLDLKPKPF